MKLSAPKQTTFWVAVIVAVVGIILRLLPTLAFSSLGFWLVVIGFIILVIGNVYEGI